MDENSVKTMLLKKNIEVANPPQTREITKAEILEEMTFALRRAMTEILLEVTNEEITGIASDIIKSETGKKSKNSVRKSGLQGTFIMYKFDIFNHFHTFPLNGEN